MREKNKKEIVTPKVVDAGDFSDIQRQSVEGGQPVFGKFECPFCGKAYAREAAFLRHTCRKKEIHEEMNSLAGKTAFILYNKWMQSNHRPQQDVSVFVTSRYYKSFFDFSEYAKRVHLYHVDFFIKVMNNLRLEPSSWSSELAYAAYSDAIKELSPLQEIGFSIECFKSLKRNNHVESDWQVFEKIGIFRIIHLIEVKHLSPWFLLIFEPFSIFYDSLEDEQQEEFGMILDPKEWGIRFAENPEVLDAGHALIEKEL